MLDLLKRILLGRQIATRNSNTVKLTPEQTAEQEKWRKAYDDELKRRENLELIAVPNRDEPIPFGYKTSWFAVKGEDTSTVAEMMGLDYKVPVNWDLGMHYEKAPYQSSRDSDHRRAFVCPPTQGWTLIEVGLYYDVTLEKERAEVVELLTALSRRFE